MVGLTRQNFQQHNARLQEQNDILHKQTVKLQEHTDTLSREVERLSVLEVEVVNRQLPLKLTPCIDDSADF